MIPDDDVPLVLNHLLGLQIDDAMLVMRLHVNIVGQHAVLADLDFRLVQSGDEPIDGCVVANFYAATGIECNICLDIAKIPEFDRRQLAHKPQIQPPGKAFDMDIRFAFDLVDDQRQACRTIAKILDRLVAERYLSIASADKFDAGYLRQLMNLER